MTEKSQKHTRIAKKQYRKGDNKKSVPKGSQSKSGDIKKK